MSYCQFSKTNSVHKPYHDLEYGFPVQDDSALFERLALEINQAGLSWDLMLKKRQGFNRAFKNFDIDKMARLSEREVLKLLKDESIVRNRLKIEALIHNAKVIKAIRKQHGSFVDWINNRACEAVELKDWIRLFRLEGFKFIGGEIMKEFLQSVGILPSPHDRNCPVNKDIFKARVLVVVSGIKKGETMTYGQVAKLAGRPGAARAVGALMKANRNRKIPCHRVVARAGLGGYNGLRGESKQRLLEKERVHQGGCN